MKEVNFVILCLGYVEGAAVTPLVFSTQLGHGGYMSPRDALITLAKDLFARYKSEKPIPRKCCILHAVNDEFNHCPICGNALSTVHEDVADDFVESLWGILSATNDNYGYEGVEIGDEYHYYRWMPTAFFASSIKEGTCLVVPEKGDSVMVAIIEGLNPSTFADPDDVMCYLHPSPADFSSTEEWLDKLISEL